MNTFNKIIYQTKNFFINHQPFILFSIVVLITPIFLSYIPYVNLVYTFNKGVLMYIVIVILLIRPPTKFFLMIGIVLLFLALTLLILGFTYVAEQFGNIILFLLAIRVISMIASHFKEIRQ